MIQQLVMQFSLSHIALCMTALCVSQAFAAPVDATQTETLDFGWKFARFGKMPDGTVKQEPGKSASMLIADSEESGNPASNAMDGDRSTRWCAADNKSGHNLTIDMGRAVSPQEVKIIWEKQAKHLFTLEGSTDGRSWKKLAEVSSGDNQTQEDSAKISGTYRYYKLTVKGNGGANWASVREISLLDEKDQPLLPKVSGNNADKDHPKSISFNDSQWRSLNLPHDWGIEGPFRMELENETGKLPWVGIGWYRKTLDIPAKTSGNRFYLDFDGVMSRPKIYVNGELAGEWKYGYSSFRVDITPYIRVGQRNTIAVRVDNPPHSSRWYPGGGIYRHVWLNISNPVHIDQWGVFVKTPEVRKELAQVDVETSVVNQTDAVVTPVVKEEILQGSDVVASQETEGAPISPGKKGSVATRLEVKNPALWTMKSPHMYTIRTTVMVDGKQVDERTTDFGIRTVEWKPDGFYLNGDKIKLKGVCQHGDLGPLGTAVHKAGYERQVRILKEMGVNSIRTSHNPPAPELLEACDRNGVVVIDELFDMWHEPKKGQDYHNYFDEWHERDLINFVHRDRNHPSVVLWSSGNEISEQHTADGPKYSQMLTDLFHREDPTRLVTAGCNVEAAARNGFGDTVDVYGFNYKPWAYNKFSKDRPNQPVYGSETASCVSTRGEYFFPVPENWDKNKGFYNFQVSSYDLFAPGWAYRPDVEFAAQEDSPTSAGEYVWTGFDYLGEPTPYNRDQTNAANFTDEKEREAYMKLLKEMGNKAPSRSSYFGIVDLCGFPKDRFYIYQAHWRPELPVAHILPHWNWPERKGLVTPVHVYTSGDEAELFLNGKSLGVRKKGKGEKDRYRLVWNDVVYQPGELKVVARKDGKEWAQETVRTTGEPASIRVRPETDSIVGDGRDLAYITISLRDKNGLIVPTANNELAVKVTGAADIAGICNGDPTDFTVMSNPNNSSIMKIKAFHGLAQVILRSKRGQSGKAILQVISKGLKPSQTEVIVREATPEQLKK